MTKKKGVKKQVNVVAAEPTTTAATTSKISKTTYMKNETFEALVVIPPDGGFGWVIVAASFLCQFLTDGSMYTFGIFIKEIKYSLNCTESQVTLSSSIQNSCYNISGPIVCALTNRFGFRSVAITGVLLTAISYSVSSFAQSFYLLVFAHGFMGGIGFGMIYIPSVIIVGFYFERWRALATSIIVSGSAFGTVVFPMLFDILLKHQTWRFKFRIISGIALSLLMCVAVYRPIKPTRIVRASSSGPVPTKIDLQSIASTMTSPVAAKQIFSKSHNLAFPTTADMQKSGAYSFVVNDVSPNSSEVVISPSNASEDSISIYQTEFNKSLLEESKRLDTIDEYPEHVNCCQICCLKMKHKYPCRCYRKRNVVPFRPMYRDDVFFTSSIAAASHYSQKPYSDKKSTDYHMSVTRVMTRRDYEEEHISCVCCPEAIKRTLATMFDCSIIRLPSFVILICSAFMSTLGIYIPYLFMVDAAKKEGHMKPNLAVMLMTVLGISNAVGRLSCGLISLFPKIRPLELSSASLAMAGICTVFYTIVYTIPWQFSYVVLYGLGLAFTSATRPLIIVELVGLEKLSNGFGMQALFQGLACLVGIPTATFLLEWHKSYTIPFVFSGIAVLIAGILLAVVRIVHNKEKSKQRNI